MGVLLSLSCGVCGDLQFLRGEQQIEHAPADRGRVVQRHHQEVDQEERDAETFLHIDRDESERTPVPHRFRRRILPFPDVETHQQERNQIHQRHDRENPRQMRIRMRQHQQIEHESGAGPGDPEQRHEPPEELRGHHIGEQIVEHRRDEQIEHLIGDRENGDHHDNGFCGAAARSEGQIVDPRADAVAPPEQDQEEHDERTGEQQIGDPASPAAPGPVAGRADDRVDDEIQQRGKASHQESDGQIVCIVILQHQRQQSRGQRLHHPEAEIAPEHPDEQHDQRTFRIGESPDRVESRSLSGRCILIHK